MPAYRNDFGLIRELGLLRIFQRVLVVRISAAEVQLLFGCLHKRAFEDAEYSRQPTDSIGIDLGEFFEELGSGRGQLAVLVAADAPEFTIVIDCKDIVTTT